MSTFNKKIIDALNWRYAIKIFDKNKKVSDEDLNTILESGRLSPSSNGLEPWRFFLIENPEVRMKIFEASKQPKVTDASHLLVIAYDTNTSRIIEERLERTAKIQNQNIDELTKYKEYLEKGIESHDKKGDTGEWLRAQSYIPLGMMLMTSAMLGIDAGPMEGFNREEMDEILGIKGTGIFSTSMIAFGHRGDDPYTLKPKIRRGKEEVIKII